MSLSADERQVAQRLIAWALEEDLGSAGDVTSLATIPAETRGTADFVARSPGVLAGLPLAADVMFAVDSGLAFTAHVRDGARLKPGERIATVTGSMRSILKAERVALNFLQHLSGIATLTAKFVEAVRGTRAQILDTRKTLPGWRLLAKYAVRCGGGVNHRLGLYDAILVKDNHLAALGGSIAAAVASARETFPELPIELEVDSLTQLEAALPLAPAIILLDNMTPETMREAVRRRDAQAPTVKLEASGGVNLQSVAGIAGTGVERISVGALTHSAPALDVALDYRN